MNYEQPEPLVPLERTVEVKERIKIDGSVYRELDEQRFRHDLQDLKQQESIASLESKLNSLTTQMSVLLAERESLNWHYIEVHIFLMMVEVVMVVLFLFVCVSRLSHPQEIVGIA